MTDIWILSDLHIDSNAADLAIGPHPACDLILMAGDLIDGDRDASAWLNREFSDAERSKMAFTPGNHEAYGIGIDGLSGAMARLADATGITVLNNDVAELAGMRLIGTTLWSDFDPRLDREFGTRGDFKHIPGFRPDDWRRLHEEAVAFLQSRAEPGDVWLLHHAPSFDGLATAMQHNMGLLSLASGYYTDLSPLVARLAPSLIVHGHTHIHGTYRIGDVPVVSNARGRGRSPHFVGSYVLPHTVQPSAGRSRS